MDTASRLGTQEVKRETPILKLMREREFHENFLYFRDNNEKFYYNKIIN